MLNLLSISKYNSGGSHTAVGVPPAEIEAPAPGRGGLFPNKVRGAVIAAALCTFLGQQVTFLPDVQAEVPADTGSITVPLGQQYRGNSFNNTPAGFQDVIASRAIKAAYIPTPISAYRGPSFIGLTPRVETVITEADELTNKRRVLVSATYPYESPAYVNTKQPDQVIVEYDERVQSRTSLYEPIRPYGGKSYVQTRQPGEIDELLTSRRASFVPPQTYKSSISLAKPPIAEIVIDDSSKKTQKNIEIPIGKYRAPIWLYSTIPPNVIAGPDELLSGRRSADLRVERPYEYYGLTEFGKPDEVDELLTSRRIQFIPSVAYKTFFRTQNVPPPETIEAPELTVRNRAIVVPKADYRDTRYVQTRQPEDNNELIASGRAIVIPKAVYAGKAFAQFPPIPEIVVVEADELAVGRRAVYEPVSPYAKNLSRVQLIQVPEIVVVEAPELTVAKVMARSVYPFYSPNITRAIYRQLDEYPRPSTITGLAVRSIAQDILSPIRTPLYARKIGNQWATIVKDSTPWATWFAKVSEQIKKQLKLTVTLDYPPTAPQSTNDAKVTVVGAQIGDTVSLGVHPDAVLQNTSYFAFVSAKDEVTIRFINSDPLLIQDPPSASFGIIVHKQ